MNMKLKIFIYPEGPSIREITNRIDMLSPSLAEPIKKQAISFAAQIMERLEQTTFGKGRNHFFQNQSLSDENHTIVLIGRPTKPTFWQKLLS